MDVKEAIKTIQSATANCRTGDRHIVVLDRGWIFVGNLSCKDDVYTLSNCKNIRKWSTGGFGALSRSAKESGATMDDAAPLRFDKRAMIFVVPVGADWDE